MKYFPLIIISLFLVSSSAFAFDIETVDETKEGIEKAKKEKQKVIRAKDGKVILKAMPRTILEPMAKNIIQSLKRKIIYPIGAIPPKPDVSEAKAPEKPVEENVFLSKDELEKNSQTRPLNIKVDSDFKKNSDSNTTEDKDHEISPVNIE